MSIPIRPFEESIGIEAGKKPSRLLLTRNQTKNLAGNHDWPFIIAGED